MDDKKKFFELLTPRQSLVAGLLGAFLLLGTVGFFVLAPMTIRALRTEDKVGEPRVLGDAKGANPVALAPTPSVPKSDRPKVELFVMSYCPYGLQTQKGMLPTWALLGKKADIDVKFVSYAMHGQKEVEENTRQYCIEKQGAETYRNYVQCFAASGDSATCLGTAKVNQSTLSSCVAATDKQFGITRDFQDQKSWLGGQFPRYAIHEGLNKQYGVQGSPTLVINGQAVDSGRSPEELKRTICVAFNNPPAECSEALSTASFQPGFGMQTNGSGANAQVGCGT